MRISDWSSDVCSSDLFAAQNPDKPAVIMAGTGQTISYAELDAEANRLSHLFRAAGLQQGDHVALCMENHPRFLSVMWGAHYAGLYYTAMSSRLTTEEMAYIVADCGAQAIDRKSTRLHSSH